MSELIVKKICPNQKYFEITTTRAGQSLRNGKHDVHEDICLLELSILYIGSDKKFIFYLI